MDSDERFASTEYFVEATSFERGTLLFRNGLGDKYTVEEDRLGKIFTIGHLDNRPVALDFFWAKINGCRICFYNSESQVVDWKMIEDSLSKQFSVYREHHTNADNFHHALSYIREKYGQA